MGIIMNGKTDYLYLLLSDGYRKINKRWETDDCEIDSFQIFRIDEMKSFCNFLDISKFELELVESAEYNYNDKLRQKYRGLYTEIECNINIFNKKESVFKSYMGDALLDYNSMVYDKRIAQLYKDINEIADYVPNKEIEIEFFKKLIVETEKEKDRFIEEKRYILNNYYQQIYSFSIDLLTLLNQYLYKIPNYVSLFEMETVGKIYKEWNDILWESVSDVELLGFFNNPSNVLKIKKNQKERFLVLLRAMYEKIKTKDNEDVWKQTIKDEYGNLMKVTRLSTSESAENETFMNSLKNILGYDPK